MRFIPTNLRGQAVAYIAMTVMLAGLGLFLRLSILPLENAYVGSDDGRWVRASVELGSSDANVSWIYFTRPFFLILERAWSEACGSDSASLGLMMCSLCTINFVILAACFWVSSDWGGAFFSMLFYATYPMFTVYDLMALPDGLGVSVMLLACLLLIMAQKGKRYCYFGAAFLMGCQFGIKTYFVISIVPLLWVVLSDRGTGFSARFRVGLTIGAFVLALCVVRLTMILILPDEVSGEATSKLADVGDYAERLQASSLYSKSSALKSVISRTSYIRWGLAASGLHVALLLAVLFTTVQKLRTDMLATFLVSNVIIFSLFLGFFPVNFSPLVFVEMQPRYFTVLAPFTCLLVGISLGEVVVRYFSGRSRVAICGCLTATAIFTGAESYVAAECFVVKYSALYGNPALRPIEETLESNRMGLDVLVFPSHMEPKFPLEFSNSNLQIQFGQISSRKAGPNMRIGVYLSAQCLDHLILPEMNQSGGLTIGQSLRDEEHLLLTYFGISRKSLAEFEVIALESPGGPYSSDNDRVTGAIVILGTQHVTPTEPD